MLHDNITNHAAMPTNTPLPCSIMSVMKVIIAKIVSSRTIVEIRKFRIMPTEESSKSA